MQYWRRSDDEVAGILRYCSEHLIAVVPFGGAPTSWVVSTPAGPVQRGRRTGPGTGWTNY